MDYRTLYGYFWFGTCCRYLEDAAPDTKVKGDGFIQFNLDRFKIALDELHLPVSSRLAEIELDELIEELDSYEEGIGISEKHSKFLNKKMRLIRKTLDAELDGVGAWRPSPKRLELAKLLDNVSDLFRPDVYNQLPEVSRYDFAEAGRCIAFDRPTAAAFHILRGTEGVLRHYYKAMVRRNRISSKNWGPIVQDLRTKRNTSSQTVLNDHLDNIRSSFRNPTQHPDYIYDIHEAQDLWSVCTEVVNRMINVMKSSGRL